MQLGCDGAGNPAISIKSAIYSEKNTMYRKSTYGGDLCQEVLLDLYQVIINSNNSEFRM
jgi:hypothetical protein